MSVNIEDVRHIALLARLEFSDEELQTFTGQMNEILSYADKINELDTANIAPTSHVMPISNVFRDDEVQPSLPVEEAICNCPLHDSAMFIVPKVTESS